MLRFLLGLVIVIGADGAMNADLDASLFYTVLAACIGIVFCWWPILDGTLTGES